MYIKKLCVKYNKFYDEFASSRVNHETQGL